MNRYGAKIEFIENSNDQEEIIELARNDSDWHVRQIAVKYIESQDVLKDIFKNELITSVCISAMERISDVDFLIDICLNNPFSHVRLATLNRILDEALLANDDLNSLLMQVILNDPDDFVARVAVENENLNNQDILVNIAKSRRDVSLRRAAISRIRDEEILIDFALNDSDVLIRREAIVNVHLVNFNALGEIVKNDCDEFNRHWACGKITDGDYLLDLIFDESFYPCLDELSKNSNLTSNDYFVDVYRTGSNEYRRRAAVHLISDESVLDNIVLAESSDEIRIEAIKNEHFTNQKIIRGLILSETDSDVLSNLILKVSSEDILIDYVKNNLNDSKATLLAILKIDEEGLLNELSGNDSPQIRFQAVKSISQKSDKSIFGDVLRNMALNDDELEIRLEAVNVIDDRSDLIEIASASGDREIKLAALRNIKPQRLLDQFFNDDATSPAEFKLNSIALNESDGEIRQTAISKLNDKPALDEIISLGNDDSQIAQNRLNTLFEDIKLINRKVLLESLILCGDSDVSYVAQKTLDDLSQWRGRINQINGIDDIDELKSIARNDFNYYVRCEAEGKLEKILFNIRLDEVNAPDNQEKLKCIVKDTSFTPEIRRNALLKITDDQFLEEYSDEFKLEK